MIDDDDDDFSYDEDEKSDNVPFRQFGDTGSSQPKSPATVTTPAVISPAPAPGPKSPPRPKKDRPVG